MFNKWIRVFFFFYNCRVGRFGGKAETEMQLIHLLEYPFLFFFGEHVNKDQHIYDTQNRFIFPFPPPDPFPTLYSCIRVFNALTSEFVVVCGSVDVGRSHQLKGVHKTIGFAIMPYISCTKLLERRIRLISRRVISWRFIIFCFVYVSHAISIPFTDKMTHAWVSRKHFNFFICVWGVYIVLG